ncbi:hypothetical protein [Staphylococcus xylosus]|nr:hypothetical protein [Staphylococcus xylosus]MCR1813602.1 hypothetical protein [Staphylococcus xylosus]
MNINFKKVAVAVCRMCYHKYGLTPIMVLHNDTTHQKWGYVIYHF